MAKAKNIPLEVYTVIFDALEADDRWAALFPEGNRIRTDRPVDPQVSRKRSIGDADTPQARMRIRSGGSALRTSNVTFGTHSDPDCDYTEKMSLIYRMTLTSQLMTLREDSQISIETVRVIRGLGAKLGTDYVVGVKLKWETEEKPEGAGDDEGEDPRVRQVTTLDIMVDVEVDPTILQE